MEHYPVSKSTSTSENNAVVMDDCLALLTERNAQSSEAVTQWFGKGLKRLKAVWCGAMYYKDFPALCRWCVTAEGECRCRLR